MEKKIYITPQCKLHICCVRCLDTFSGDDMDEDGDVKSKSTGGTIWDDFDDNFENK